MTDSDKKTLVIHPEDDTTAFLEPIYSTVKNKTVIRGGVNIEELNGFIRSHDRIMMMGHGSPYGLLSVGRFPGAGLYIIDQKTAPLLKEKRDSVFLWCYAGSFVETHNLEGFCSGMFVSEVVEAIAMGLGDTVQSMIDQSNTGFSAIMSKYINLDSSLLFANVKQEYWRLTYSNPVARYNHKRLFFNIN